MKKFVVGACLLGVLAVSSFSQPVPSTPPAEAGAKRVAERDAAWLNAHPGSAKVADPMVLKKARHVKHAKHVKHGKHLKKGKHTKHAKHKIKKAKRPAPRPVNSIQ